eukprot:TRINITY_DN6172_c0_g1_i1.p1 TRINITY_DN6172_c0_g1~~TRINITY_DN6172_c0_g1_i1.p1  ORF type:complete len:270 (+),score=64.13 TRINITY_DN6172_c0_g1_i1:78-887(+)
MVLTILLVCFVLWVVAVYFLSDSAPPVSLNGAHVVISGGNSGIGLSVAIEVAKRGASVTILARDKKKLLEAKEIIQHHIKEGRKVIDVSVDVTNYESVRSAIEEAALANQSRIDVLVCSAGVTNVERFLETDMKKTGFVSEVNYLGSLYCTRAAVPFMQKHKGGRIIYVSSLLGLLGFPGYSTYVPTKFAVRGLAESLQSELSPWNIWFSVSVPGNVDTPMFLEEEKTKPPETKFLETGNKAVHPDKVALLIVESLKNWRFVRFCEMEG